MVDSGRAVGAGRLIGFSAPPLTRGILKRHSNTEPTTTSKSFIVEKFFDWKATNIQVYKQTCQPLSDRLYEGYNCFVLAYGSEGSGKGHTLYGDVKEPGSIISNLADDLYKRIDRDKNKSKFFVTISAYEVHGSVIIDLLNPNTKTGLVLLDHRSFGCYVDGIAELEVTNAGQIVEYVKQAVAVHHALDMRMTNLSHPHTIIDLRLEVIDNDNPFTIRTSTFRLANLAAASGQALKNNPGLQSFESVVDALAAEKDPWLIPYNSSKLTRILEPGLGGNAVTVALMFVDPRVAATQDSFHTMEIGEKLMKVGNTTKINKNTINAAIRELREEIKKARGKLNLNQPGQYMHDIDPNSIKVLKQLISELDRVKSQTWDKRRSRSIEMLNVRKESLTNEGLLYTLNEEVEVPTDITAGAKKMLTDIVNLKNTLEETEAELLEKRNMYQRRLESSAKKNVDEEGKTDKDEKLIKLEKLVMDCSEKRKQQQADLSGLEEEYKKLMMKIANLEAKQRKTFLMSKDYAALERLNKAHEWSEMKKEMEKDSNLNNELKAISSTFESNKESLNASYDALGVDTAQSLKDDAIRTAALLKDQQELAKKLTWERDTLWSKLIEMKFRNEVQLNKYQEHMFFIFRNYRSHFEEQKERIETRYRELLENSVKDALKLSEENLKLRTLLDAKNKQI